MAYKLWHQFLPHFPKTARYTLGNKINSSFTETVALIIKASYSSPTAKLPLIIESSTQLDLLKFFLQLAWEIKALDTKQYIALSQKTEEIGKMLGGWLKSLQK